MVRSIKRLARLVQYPLPWLILLTDESGWAWFIPLHNDIVSVGVVMDKDISSEKKKRYATDDYEAKTLQFYLEELKHAPGLIKLLGTAQLRTLEGESPLKTTSDFSYAASDHAGDHFRIAGDAGGALAAIG
jgi:flavine halogenase